VNRHQKRRQEKMARKGIANRPGEEIYDHLEAAVRFSQSGDLKQAAEALETVFHADPDNIDATIGLANIHATWGDMEAAIPLFEKAAAICPGEVEAHFNLGRALSETGRLDDAVASYQKALAIEPDLIDAHHNIGNALKKLGRLDEALASYHRVLALNPNSVAEHNNLGTTLQNLGRLDEALASYDRALASDPDNSMVHSNKGSLLLERGRLDEALASYERALASNPDSSITDYHLGILLQKLGRPEDALVSFERALASDLNSPESLECLYALGRYDDFYKRLEESIEADGTNIGIAALSGYVSNQLDRENPHPFCKNPLDCIRVGKIGYSVGDIEELSNSLVEELLQVKTNWEPYKVTTRSGYQTPGNIFANPQGSLAKLDRIIKAEIQSYHSEYKSMKCSFMDFWPGEFRLSGWFVRLLGGGHQRAHIHRSGWLSGVVYLKLPEAPIGDDGCIEFSLNGYDHPLLNDDYPRTMHRPQKGQIVLFPSSLFHRTVPIKADEERMCVSFDLHPA
jgi:tetratricopeptide (TPR) repeat protein